MLKTVSFLGTVFLMFLFSIKSEMVGILVDCLTAGAETRGE